MQRLTPYRPPLPREQPTQPEEPLRAGRCPFVGSAADPGTALAFPSDANHCYRTDQAIPVSAIHQETYCLSMRHTSCPVYRQNVLISPQIETGPAGVIGQLNGGAAEVAVDEFIYREDDGAAAAATTATRRRAISLTSLLILAILLGLFYLAWVSWRGNLAQRDGQAQPTIGVEVQEPPAAPPTPLVTGEGELVASVAPAGGADATLVFSPTPPAAADQPPEQTPLLPGVVAGKATATPTASPSATEATEEACGPPQWWARVVVEAGDTIESLAEDRGVTVEEVLQANCLDDTAVLTPGRTIFLPPLGIIVTLEPATTLPAPTTSRPAGGGSNNQPLPTPTPFPSPVPTQGTTPQGTTPLPPDPTSTSEIGPAPTSPPPATPTPVPTQVVVPTEVVAPTNTPPAPPTLPPTSTPPGNVGATPTRQATPTATVVPTKTPPGG
jgi:LysM repeat protein